MKEKKSKPKTDKDHNQNRTPEQRKKRFNKAALKAAILGSYGNITVIADRLHCQRNTVYAKLEKYPELKSLIEDERERIVDLAENKLLTNINSGETSSIHFVLKTLGKKRGYIERQEVDHSGSVDIKKINFKSLTDDQLTRLQRMLSEGIEIKTALLSIGVIIN